MKSLRFRALKMSIIKSFQREKGCVPRWRQDVILFSSNGRISEYIDIIPTY